MERKIMEIESRPDWVDICVSSRADSDSELFQSRVSPQNRVSQSSKSRPRAKSASKRHKKRTTESDPFYDQSLSVDFADFAGWSKNRFRRPFSEEFTLQAD